MILLGPYELKGPISDDSLNKTNQMFKELYAEYRNAGLNASEALSKINQMVGTAENALSVARQSNDKSDDTQQQLDNIVLNDGTGNAEVIQARGNEPLLKDRLNKTDSQLAEKANQSFVENEVNDLDEQKADKGAVGLLSQSKRDKDVEIGMADLDQETREAFTGGSVAVVGEDSVGEINLKDNAVSRDKINNDFLINNTSLAGDEDDLDYALDVGTRLVYDNVLNNPIKNGYALLNVERMRGSQENFLWVKQTITTVETGKFPFSFYRVLRFSVIDTKITYKSMWKELLVDNIKRDKLDRHYNMVFPWLSQETDDLDSTWETGIYMINENVQNNPANSIAILEVYEAKSTQTSALSWVKQVVTLSLKNTEPIIYYRVIQVDVETEELRYVHKWKLLGGGGYQGVKWIALGTSHTSRGEYANYVSSKLGLVLDNRGVGSGGITNGASNGNTTMQAIDNLEDSKGFVSVDIGGNDWRNIELGELGDETDSTFYGALKLACSKLTQKTTARVFLITTPNGAYHLDAETRRDPMEKNSYGYRYRDYVKAIKDVAQCYSIPVIDTYGRSGLGGYRQNHQTLVDHIHMSEIGAEIVGEYIVQHLLNEIKPFPNALIL